MRTLHGLWTNLGSEHRQGLIDFVQTETFLALLKVADKTQSKARFLGEFFLCQTGGLTIFPDVFRYRVRWIHVCSIYP